MRGYCIRCIHLYSYFRKDNYLCRQAISGGQHLCNLWHNFLIRDDDNNRIFSRILFPDQHVCKTGLSIHWSKKIERKIFPSLKKFFREVDKFDSKSANKEREKRTEEYL